MQKTIHRRFYIVKFSYRQGIKRRIVILLLDLFVARKKIATYTDNSGERFGFINGLAGATYTILTASALTKTACSSEFCRNLQRFPWCLMPYI